MKKEKEEGESITTLKDFLLSAIFQSWQKFYLLNFLTFFQLSDVFRVGWTIDFHNDLHASVGGFRQNAALQSHQSRNAPGCPRRSMEAGRSM